MIVGISGKPWSCGTVFGVPEKMERLEQRIEELRTAVRRAAVAGDRAKARALRADLRQAEHEWDEALADIEDRAQQVQPPTPDRQISGALLPIREQVHQVLTLLSVPAAPKLIVAAHNAFFAGEIVGARLTSLRRDEERSFRSAPFARPYYLCAALMADLLAPARGLLAVSTWSMQRRIIGPLSPRVDYLNAAIRVAEHIERVPDPPLSAKRLLWRFAANIPSAADSLESTDPARVAKAAMAELDVHLEADSVTRAAAADRARRQLDDAEQLFGGRLQGLARTAS